VADNNWPKTSSACCRSQFSSGEKRQNHFWGIVSTRAQLDPNWYIDSTFRDQVKKLISQNKITLILDIHGSSLQNQELIFFLANKAFLEKFSDKLTGVELRNFIDNDQLTLAEDLDFSTAVLEIEIREDGLVSTINPQNFHQAQVSIDELIRSLK